MSWLNRTLTTDQQCSDCWLGGLALELASSFGYDDVLASNYASLTSSCNATAYTYTIPTQHVTETTTHSNCNCLTQVYAYMNGDYQCDDIESDYGITAMELTAWNPWLAGIAIQLFTQTSLITTAAPSALGCPHLYEPLAWIRILRQEAGDNNNDKHNKRWPNADRNDRELRQVPYAGRWGLMFGH
ncbi:hypothetical protein HFD88_003930 [Aspergillus terreus]|nr:hypothetical protein HFD88_003930 [Aspergillus terreus]